MSDEARQLAAACLWPSFRGPQPPPWLLDLVDAGLGGVVLFGSNVETPDQLLALTSELRSHRRALPIALDEEGGDVTRLHMRTGAWSPGNLALGTVDDVAVTAEVATEMARELRACGITTTFAPVADLLLDAGNPIVGTRSFGDDAARVSRHVAAFVSATQRQGVAACVKHFPGHGATPMDSHREVPRVEVAPDLLRSRELVAFQAAADAGVRAVMVGHLVVPAFDSVVATLSRTIATDLLRGELGFDGLVISDALDMAGASQETGVAEAAVRALAAGIDALCLGPIPDVRDIDAVLEAIVAATQDGRLSHAHLAEAALRGQTLARWLGAAPGPHPRAIDTTVGLDAARRAVRVHGKVSPCGDPVVFELHPEPTIAAGNAAWGLEDALRALGGHPRMVVMDASYAALDSALGAARGHPLVVVCRDAVRHAWQRDVLARVAGERPDLTIVEMGVPSELPLAGAVVVTSGASRVSTLAAAELLTGARAAAPEAFVPSGFAQTAGGIRERDR
ncbi:MAG TPA: glycoside hydrolase family 3 N-terminal domain-containing protein [Candidatus Dormibacteraeota bacterium]